MKGFWAGCGPLATTEEDDLMLSSDLSQLTEMISFRGLSKMLWHEMKDFLNSLEYLPVHGWCWHTSSTKIRHFLLRHRIKHIPNTKISVPFIHGFVRTEDQVYSACTGKVKTVLCMCMSSTKSIQPKWAQVCWTQWWVHIWKCAGFRLTDRGVFGSVLWPMKWRLLRWWFPEAC